MTRIRTAVVYSAGGVVLRGCGGDVQIVLVGQTSRGTWGLPKGGPSKGENLEQTAARETSEETGLNVRILAPIDSIDYWFVAGGKRFHKTVHYFLMESLGGDLSRHDAENDRVEWIPLTEAYSKMSYQNEVGVVRRAVSLWTRLKGGDCDGGSQR